MRVTPTPCTAHCSASSPLQLAEQEQRSAERLQDLQQLIINGMEGGKLQVLGQGLGLLGLVGAVEPFDSWHLIVVSGCAVIEPSTPQQAASTPGKNHACSPGVGATQDPRVCITQQAWYACLVGVTEVLRQLGL